MKIIIDIFNEVITDEYLPLLFVLLLCAFGFSIIEDIIGTIVGSMKNGFDLKFKIFGLLKRIAIGLTLMAFAFVVDYFVITLNHLPSFEIETQIVTILEIVAMVVTWCVDSCKGILEKFKSIKELKYIKYEDVHYNEGDGTSI